MERLTGAATRGLVAGLFAGSALTGLWVGMSYALDLTFHFHPALVPAAAGWGYRRGLVRSGSLREGVALTVMAAALEAGRARNAPNAPRAPAGGRAHTTREVPLPPEEDES